MAGRARFTRKYTDEQIEAFLRAVLIDHTPVAAAVRKAEAGQLGVPGFTLNRVYAYELVKRRREGYEQEHPEAAVAAIDKALMALANKALSQSRILAKAEMADPDAIKRTVQALTTARAAIRPETRPAPKQSASPKGEPEPSNTAENTLTSLLTTAQKAKRTNSGQQAPGPVRSLAS